MYLCRFQLFARIFLPETAIHNFNDWGYPFYDNNVYYCNLIYFIIVGNFLIFVGIQMSYVMESSSFVIMGLYRIKCGYL